MVSLSVEDMEKHPLDYGYLTIFQIDPSLRCIIDLYGPWPGPRNVRNRVNEECRLDSF